MQELEAFGKEGSDTGVPTWPYLGIPGNVKIPCENSWCWRLPQVEWGRILTAGTRHGVFETPQRIALHRCVETLPSGGPEHHAAETRKSGLCGDPNPQSLSPAGPAGLDTAQGLGSGNSSLLPGMATVLK